MTCCLICRQVFIAQINLHFQSVCVFPVSFEAVVVVGKVWKINSNKKCRQWFLTFFTFIIPPLSVKSCLTSVVCFNFNEPIFMLCHRRPNEWDWDCDWSFALSVGTHTHFSPSSGQLNEARFRRAHCLLRTDNCTIVFQCVCDCNGRWRGASVDVWLTVNAVHWLFKCSNDGEGNRSECTRLALPFEDPLLVCSFAHVFSPSSPFAITHCRHWRIGWQ